MIALLLNDVPFEQDIRELFMAYYPGEKYVRDEESAKEAGIVFRAGAIESGAADAGPAEAAPGPGSAAVSESAGEAAPGPAPEAAPEAPAETAEGLIRMTLEIRGAEHAGTPGPDRGSEGTEEPGKKPAGEAETPVYREFYSLRYPERLFTKNALKRALYKTLRDVRGYELPWGTLTGIRPAKLALTSLLVGKTPAETAMELSERYLMSVRKRVLCVRTAVREREVISGLDLKHGWSLYIGIPFCPTTCLYCSFTSYPVARYRKQGLVERYLNALCEELSGVAELMQGHRLETIYVGGGTPTSLAAEELDRLLSFVESRFDLAHVKELTVECGRPDSITREKLKALKAHGVTRISINPQTLKEETLRLIGRHHTVQQFRECFAMAREEGFDSINTDLIMGLPGETEEDVRRTMEGIAALAPDDVTIHSLALKRASRLHEKQEEYAAVGYGDAQAMVDLASEYCQGMGLTPYYLYRQKNMAGNLENVGWCRPGHEGLYNILIMEELQTIVGCGAGTTTRVMFQEENRYERAETVKDPELYCEQVEEMLNRKRAVLENWN